MLSLWWCVSCRFDEVRSASTTPVNMSVIPLVPVVVPRELLGGRLASVTAGYGGDSLMLV